MDGIVLLGLLFAQQFAETPSGPLQVEAFIALGGQVSSSSLTELRVTVAGPGTGEVEMEIVGGSTPVKFSLRMTPGEPATISVPLNIDFSRSPALQVTNRVQESQREIPLDYIRSGRPPFVLAGALATQSLIHLENTVSVSSSGLPRFAPAYKQVQGIAVDGTELASLDDDQLRALLDYAGTCGRVLLIDVTASVEKIFGNRAACDQAFLSVIGSTDDVAANFVQLSTRRAIQPPSAAQLVRLLRKTDVATLNPTLLGYFWAGYLIVLLALALTVKSRFSTVGFSFVGMLLILLIWPRTASNAFVAWAEASSTSRIARYTALEQTIATRRGVLTLPASSFGTYPDRIEGENFELRWHTDRNEQQVRWNTFSFQRLHKFVRGSFAIEPALRMDSIDSVPVVCNAGPNVSLEAYLRWEGQVFLIAPLQPGASWSAENQSALEFSATEYPELQLFLRRSANHGTTLLQSLNISRDNNSALAWLMRYEPEQNGRSPCAA